MGILFNPPKTEMYDFGQKNCVVCDKSFRKVQLGYIIDGQNAPYDSYCFCIEHKPFFLNNVSIDWIGRIKNVIKIH